MSISLKELKKNRLTPAEKFILETIDGAKPETQPSSDVKWCKDGKYLFEQDFKNGYLDVSYRHIWSVLENEFGLNYSETKELIKNVMYDYTNNGELTPRAKQLAESEAMYDYTNNGELTPELG